jgi:hypothetical protein
MARRNLRLESSSHSRAVNFLWLFGIRNTPAREIRISPYPATSTFRAGFFRNLAGSSNISADDICHARCVMDGTGAFFPLPR